MSLFNKIGKLFLAFMILFTAVVSTACKDPIEGGGDMTIEKGDKNNPSYTFVMDGDLAPPCASPQCRARRRWISITACSEATG